MRTRVDSAAKASRDAGSVDRCVDGGQTRPSVVASRLEFGLLDAVG